MRQAPEESSREERQASGPLHHSSCGCRLAGLTDDTATEPAGAGPWHCRKWSHEAKNGHAGCQMGRLDGRTESDPSEQNDTMRSYGTFLHFDIAFTGFASRAAPPKTVPEADNLHAGRHEGRVEDRAHGSIPAVAAGRPGSEDTVTAPAGAGASHVQKWFHQTKNGHAGCQKGHLDGRIGADLSQPLWQDEKVWENFVGYPIRRSCLEIYGIS
jgi:hypothetical protein